MKRELLTFQDPKSPVSEVFRTLRTNIQFMNTNRKLKTLLITSTFPEEGKSWITSNLAVTFAQAGKRVILVDADMRKGRQYNIFGVLPKPGLSNYLSNMDADNNEVTDVNIANYIQATDVPNLHILTAGNIPPNPSELLVSHRMKSLLQELKNMCDLVIIDGTPCDLVTDSIILSRIVDSTMVVAAQKQTKKDALVRVVKNIQNVGGRIAGVVLNKVDVSAKKYNQSYYYGSMSGNLPANTKKSKKDRDKMDGFISNLFRNSSKDIEFEVPSYENEDSKKDDVVEENNYNIDQNEEEIATSENAKIANDYNNNESIPVSNTETITENVQNYETNIEELPQHNYEEYKEEEPQPIYEEHKVEQVEPNYDEYKVEQPQTNYEDYRAEQPQQNYEEYKFEPQTIHEEYKVEQTQNFENNYESPIDKNDIIPNINEQLEADNIEQQEKEEYRQIKEQINRNKKDFKKNKKKNKRNHNEYHNYNESFNNNDNKAYQEIEAKVEEEGKITEVKIEQNMDEKTKEILRQVNEYIEAEKHRQGAKY